MLQAAFTKHNVQRHVDVDKLIRGKYQDNLEFCQWLKAFYDQSGAAREDYDPTAVRAKGKGGKKYNDFLEQTAGKQGSKPLPAARTIVGAKARSPAPSPQKAKPGPAANRPTTSRPTGPTRAAPVTKAQAPLKDTKNDPRKTEAVLADATLMKKNAEMAMKLKDLEQSVAELEKERDFYFGKLRNVELMLQVQQDRGWEGCDLQGVVENIFKVLYATAEEDVAVGENGEVNYVLTSPYFKDRRIKLTCSYRVTVQIIPSSAVDLSADISGVAGEGEDENLIAEY